MIEPKNILVAVKPREDGLPLLVYHARFLAESLGARLRLLSCVFHPRLAPGLTRGRAAEAQASLIESEREALEELARSVRDWGVSVETHICWGQRVDELILEEVRRWQADLLIVGTHQPGLRLHTRLTDVVWQLMRLCPCPLLLVKDPEFEEYPTILACIDPLHRHAEPAGLDRAVLETASDLAKAFDAQLSVVHAYPDPEAFELASAVEVLPGVFYGTEGIEAVHRKAVMELAVNYGIAPHQVELLPGRAEDNILRVAREQKIKLIVLGSVKRGGLEQVLLGSTAEKVAAEAGCDVWLVGQPT